MRLTLCFIMSLMLATIGGCTNPYSDFYVDKLSGKAITEFPNLIPHQGKPQLYSTNDPDRDGIALLENGYILIGCASFNAASVDPQEAIRQAEKMGAAIVLIQSRYRNTRTGAIPYTIQNPSQVATTYHSGNVYGPSGYYGSYSGTSTTMVPGDYTTTWIPYSVDRYDYNATFWVKSRPMCLGALVADLTDDLRRQIGTNRGVVIEVVAKGSPAFNADMTRGDIITKINNDVISDPQSLVSSVNQHAGQEVVLETWRDGVRREVPVRLNPKAY